MSLREVLMWTVDCDRCGANAQEGGDYSAFGQASVAVDEAVDSEWLVVQENPDKHYCPECVVWDEQRDELVPKPAQPRKE